MKRKFDTLLSSEKKHIEDEFAAAYDFDSRDPLFGLSRSEMSGPTLSRRTVLRLMAAAGTLSTWHLMPGKGAGEAHAATRGGHLRTAWAGTSEILTLDPARIDQVIQFQIASNVLSGLTHIDADLVAQPDLATDWTVSEDGKVYTFNLREGVRFHNGDPFSADDVVFTYNRSKDPKQSFHSRVIANVKEVVKVNDHTVKMVLGSPQASFFVKTLERSSGRAMTIVSRGALESMGAAQYGLMPVGTGPFKVTFHELGQGIVLERNEEYYDPERPVLDKVTITPIPDTEPLAAAIEAGDVDLLGGNSPPAELIDRFEANPDLVINTVPGPSFECISLNPHREPFKMTDFSKPIEELMKESGFKVRLAIAKAMDRERYLELAQFGRGVPAYGTINPAMGFYFDDSLGETSLQRFEPEVARQLLADAGYPNGKDFPKINLLAAASHRRDALIVADILKRNLNIEVGVDIKDTNVVIESELKMDYDMIRTNSGGDFDPDDALVDWLQTKSKFNGPERDKDKMPFGFFSDKRVDELIEAQSHETNLETRKAMVQEVNLITSTKVAFVFLYHRISILVHHRKVNYPAKSRIPGLVELDRVSFV